VNRREFIAVLVGAALAGPARAQQASMPVVGFLSDGSSDTYVPWVAAFRHGLSEAGYIEGRNATIEYRWANGQSDRLPPLAAELVNQKVAVIAATSSYAAPAAKAATATIPIVFMIGGDPVALGLVASMNRPGGNVTGIAVMNFVLMAKRFELLHEVLPGSSAPIALLLNPKNVAYAEPETREAEVAARASGRLLLLIKAEKGDEIDAAFSDLVQKHAGALIVSSDPFFNIRRDQLVALAARHRVPAIYQWRDFTEVGGLMSYGSSRTDIYRLAGNYVARILKGEKPADLPVQQPTRFELVINLKTAKALGLTVPLTLQSSADEVIE
jgi:putative ABC transport system substrate-binding protein